MQWFLFVVKNNYANFQGRAGLAEFWYFILFSTIISIVLSVVDAVAGTMVLSSLYSLAILVPTFAVGARRLHDTGRSGWWQLVLLIPLIGLIALIVMCAQKGEQGSNRFGPPGPTSPDREAAFA